MNEEIKDADSIGGIFSLPPGRSVGFKTLLEAEGGGPCVGVEVENLNVSTCIVIPDSMALFIKVGCVP